jgi:hypothetical protein
MDFTEVTMTALKKPEATKYCDHRTITPSAHTANTLARILRRRIKRNIEHVLGKAQLGFRQGKGTRDAIGMPRIISE